MGTPTHQTMIARGADHANAAIQAAASTTVAVTGGSTVGVVSRVQLEQVEATVGGRLYIPTVTATS